MIMVAAENENNGYFSDVQRYGGSDTSGGDKCDNRNDNCNKRRTTNETTCTILVPTDLLATTI